MLLPDLDLPGATVIISSPPPHIPRSHASPPSPGVLAHDASFGVACGSPPHSRSSGQCPTTSSSTRVPTAWVRLELPRAKPCILCWQRRHPRVPFPAWRRCHGRSATLFEHLWISESDNDGVSVSFSFMKALSWLFVASLVPATEFWSARCCLVCFSGWRV